MTTFLSGCAVSDGDRAEAAAKRQGEIAARQRPALPGDCRKHEASGTKRGDRLDVAALKAEQAIARGNARIDRCAAWDDDLKAGTQ